MRSVADTLREQDVADVRALSVPDRVALALRLGREALRLYASYHGCSEDEAAAALDRAKQYGRRRFAGLDRENR